MKLLNFKKFGKLEKVKNALNANLSKITTRINKEKIKTTFEPIIKVASKAKLKVLPYYNKVSVAVSTCASKIGFVCKDFINFYIAEFKRMYGIGKDKAFLYANIADSMYRNTKSMLSVQKDYLFDFLFTKRLKLHKVKENEAYLVIKEDDENSYEKQIYTENIGYMLKNSVA